jgi:hypothetical protein
MGRCVTVSTYDCGTRERKALLRTDDMYNTLASVIEAKIGNAKFLDIILKGHALKSRVFLLNEGFDVLESFARGGGYILQRKLARSEQVQYGSEYYLHDQLLQEYNRVF